MIALKVDIDPGRIFERQLTELERSQLPYAVSQTINRLAFQTRESWRGAIRGQFKNPRSFTLNAPLVLKSTPKTASATVFMRDQAAGGVAPGKYLLAQVFGGEARLKRAEVALTQLGYLQQGMRVAPGPGTRLDASGDISARQFKGILTGLKDKQSAYFAIRNVGQSHLKPGVFQRKGKGKKRNLRAVLNFIQAPRHRKRLEIFELAEKVQKRNAPEFFKQELEKAVQSTFNKKFGL